MGNSISVFIFISIPLSWSECIVFVRGLLDGGVVFSCLILAAVFLIVLGETSGLGFGTILAASFFPFDDLDFFATTLGEANWGGDKSLPDAAAEGPELSGRTLA